MQQLGFVGQHECQLDAKGRVSFPAPYRRVVSAGPLFLMVNWQATNLDLFPSEEWILKCQEMDAYHKATQDINRIAWVTSRVEQVEPDSHGRIRIGPRLRKEAGLADSVRFVGVLRRIQLWNPAAHDAHQKRAAERPACAEGEEDARWRQRVFG